MMKREGYAAALIVLAFFSGMVLTAMTSGCDANRSMDGQSARMPEESR